MTKTKTTTAANAKTATNEAGAVEAASFRTFRSSVPTPEQREQREAQRAEQALKLTGSAWSPRSPGLLPTLPDRSMLPQLGEVLDAYDKAASTIDHARQLQDRRKEIPGEIKQAEASHIEAAQTAVAAKKNLPTLDEITELKTELETIDTAMRGISAAAWSAFREWGQITQPHMPRLIEPAIDELEDALSALDAANAAVRREVDRVTSAQSLIAWASNSEQMFVPSPPNKTAPELIDGASKLDAGIERLSRYVSTVRERS